MHVQSTYDRDHPTRGGRISNGHNHRGGVRHIDVIEHHPARGVTVDDGMPVGLCAVDHKEELVGPGGLLGGRGGVVEPAGEAIGLGEALGAVEDAVHGALGDAAKGGE